MKVNGWKYYNHAAIPTTAPHEIVDTSPIEDGSIWNIDGKPILARWTSDFDCGYETNWWFVIKDKPFDIEELTAKNKKSIRQALRKCYVKKINMLEYSGALYECYFSAVSNYENAYCPVTKEEFEKNCEHNNVNIECWAGFCAETNILIGYMTVEKYDTFCNISVAKFHPEYFKCQVSDALYYTILDYYLNQQQINYISSGERSISHITGTQEYKMRRFQYRKAYCKLNVAYKPSIKRIVQIVYPFRAFFKLFDKINIVHKFNAVLLMEKLRRECKK